MRIIQRNRWANISSLDAYLYIIPAFLLYGLFFLWPVKELIQLTFMKWNGLGPKTFIGLENYQRLLTDDNFWLAFRHNVYWLIGSITVPIAFGLMLAILLSRSRMYGKVFFRTIFFLPQVLTSVSVAVIWGWIYNPNVGALNTVLEAIGLESLKQGWLASKTFALPALFIANSWVAYGFCMVIFIAAIDGIDEVYFDAAKVDGANAWQQFRHILLPFIRGPLSTIILVTAMGSFQVFDIVFVLTKGGPAYATLVIPMYMVLNAFNYHNIGYGSTIAFVLGLLILVFSVLYLKNTQNFPGAAMNLPFVLRRASVQGTRRSKITMGRSIATTFLAGMLSLIVIIPFLWVFATSVKDRAEVSRNPLGMPQEYHWENYATTWTRGNFSTYFLNSVMIAVPTVVSIIFLSMLAAYSFARLKFAGKQVLFTILLIGLTIPMSVLIVPLFYLILDLNLYNSLWSLILPQVSSGLPFAILLLRTFIQDLPQEIMDSGRIDGCSNWQLLIHIVTPLSRPALLTLLIFNFMWNWGSFLLPVILIQNESKRTLPLGLNFFIGRYTSDVPLLMAGTVITFLPVVILYVLFQRQFIKGITAGALNY